MKNIDITGKRFIIYLSYSLYFEVNNFVSVVRLRSLGIYIVRQIA